MKIEDELLLDYKELQYHYSKSNEYVKKLELQINNLNTEAITLNLSNNIINLLQKQIEQEQVIKLMQAQIDKLNQQVTVLNFNNHNNYNEDK